jgi:DNA-binding transcriptional regulator YdaS (Cro superfamily)
MNIRCFFILALLGSFLAGCASAPGSHKLLTPLNGNKFSNYAALHIAVDSKAAARLSQADKARITSQIIKAVKEQSPTRFTAINQASPGSSTLHALVAIKNYDEGNAFGRFIFYGLGQIHIDADVMLSDMATQEYLANYEVTKTFAWHGFYGGLTDIKEVETGFCKGVADAILDNS